MKTEDFNIVSLPKDPRPRKFLNEVKVNVMKDFEITPGFHPRGWRVLRPMEVVEDGDYRWTKTGGPRIGHYIPATKIGDVVGSPITYIRRV